MTDLDPVRRASGRLERLKDRLVDGAIQAPEYEKLRETILRDLTPEERTQVEGTRTPAPRPGRPDRIGPSAGETQWPQLADIEYRSGDVLFDQWRIVRELGRGGFGAVFEAEELHLDELQAVKVLDPTMVAREELLKRFRREVLLMRRLVHPRIVRVYDYREDQRQQLALISMEYVRGGSVRDLLTAAGEQQLPVELALRILAHVLEALAAAHAEGVIHRDVTPGNILLAGGTAEELLANPGRDPGVKLVDFGIAGLMQGNERSIKSQAMGTLGYAPPELLDPRADVSAAADVYGAAAVVYQLLTNEFAVGRFADPSELRPELEAEVDEVLLAALERPERRPAAAELAARAAALVERVQVKNARRKRAGLETEVRRAIKQGEPAGTRAALAALEGAGGDEDSQAVIDEARSWLQAEELRAEEERQQQPAALATAPTSTRTSAELPTGGPRPEPQPESAEVGPGYSDVSQAQPVPPRVKKVPKGRYPKALHRSVVFQAVGLGIALIVTWIDVETIMFSGPILILTGFLLAGLSWRHSLPSGIAAGLSMAVLSLGCVALINGLDWSPTDAQIPISCIVSAYCVAFWAFVFWFSGWANPETPKD